jgi:hypothetical protein
MDADALARDLLPRLRRWTQDNWSLPAVAATGVAGTGGLATGAPAAGGSGLSRGDIAAATVQRLADLGADAESRPRQPVPRLADVTLADQLAVMVEDILRTADPYASRAAAAELAALRTALGYR